MGVSKNRGTPKSSILIGFSIINHPFWVTIIFGNTDIKQSETDHLVGVVSFVDPWCQECSGWFQKFNTSPLPCDFTQDQLLKLNIG